MDIIKLLELSIEDMSMSLKLFNTLGRARYFRISDILFAGSDRIRCVKSFGFLRYSELNDILLKYRIDLNNKIRCNKFLEVYKREKIRRLGDSATELLDIPIESVSNDEKMSAFLKDKGLNCVYDVLSRHPQELSYILFDGSRYLKEWNNSYYYVELIRNIFRLGIDVRDREQCNRLLEQYTSMRSAKLKNSLNFSNNMDIAKLSLQFELLTGEDSVVDYLKNQLSMNEQVGSDIVQCVSDFSIKNSDFEGSNKIK